MKPRQWRRSPAGAYLRHLPRIKHMRGTWLHRKLGDRLFSPEMWQPERGRFASGCAIGVFFAMMPLPIQMLAAALVAYLVRANIPAAIATTWVSNPLTTPIFLLVQYQLGSLLIGGRISEHPADNVLGLLSRAPLPLLIGAFLTAAVLAAAAYPLALKSWDWFGRRFLKAAASGAANKSPAEKKNEL
jgi:uncharacterized protein